MWQRFTERARRVVFFAQEEAGRLGHNYVSTEHLLLGLLRENDSVAARVLERTGVRLVRLHEDIERQCVRGDGRLGQDMQLTPRAKRVIDLAYDEARQLNNNYIGTEHVLLGLLREAEGLGGRILAKNGASLEAIRDELLKLQDNDGHPESMPERPNRPSVVQRAVHPSQDVLASIITARRMIEHDLLGLRGKSLLSMADLSRDQLLSILDVAGAMQAAHRSKQVLYRYAYPKSIALIFEKPSLRTRTTFELGMAQLGGYAVTLGPAEIGLGTRESVPDAARNLERWVDAIVARVFDHNTLVGLRDHSSVPVINALSDREHPCQILADLFTLKQKKGDLKGLKLAWVGDGFNMLHSLLLGCAIAGVSISAACPEGCMPDAEIVDQAKALAGGASTVEVTTDPVAAVRGADAIYTDVCISMGQEDTPERRALFLPYQVNTALMAEAKPDALFLHCLPAHRGEEVTDEVLDGPQSVVFDQAENRLHAQKAVLALLMGP